MKMLEKCQSSNQRPSKGQLSNLYQGALLIVTIMWQYYSNITLDWLHIQRHLLSVFVNIPAKGFVINHFVVIC